MILVLAMLLTLAACAEAWITAQNLPEIASAMLAAAELAQPEEQDIQPTPSPAVLDVSNRNGKAVSAPAMLDEDEEDADAAASAADPNQPTDGLSERQGINAAEEPSAEPESTPAPEAISQPDSQPTAAPAPAAYGAIPFELAANTGTWWKIDTTDSAYWAVQENINAMRAAGGLLPLSMDDSLSSIASARCESFVAGGPFDHSGMVTWSEICAAGPLGSASAVCSAWQASDVHYANIMRTDISRMGVGCWFCEMDGNRYTYWTVTFE